MSSVAIELLQNSWLGVYGWKSMRLSLSYGKRPGRVFSRMPLRTLARLSDSWRRSPFLLAQVSDIFGAGLKLLWRPAPLQGIECRFPAQVPFPFSDLRQEGQGLAPKKGGTCVRLGKPAPSRADLHQAGQTCIRQDRLASGRADLHQAGQTCIRQGRLAQSRTDLHQAGQESA